MKLAGYFEFFNCQNFILMRMLNLDYLFIYLFISYLVTYIKCLAKDKLVKSQLGQNSLIMIKTFEIVEDNFYFNINKYSQIIFEQ